MTAMDRSVQSGRPAVYAVGDVHGQNILLQYLIGKIADDATGLPVKSEWVISPEISSIAARVSRQSETVSTCIAQPSIVFLLVFTRRLGSPPLMAMATS